MASACSPQSDPAVPPRAARIWPPRFGYSGRSTQGDSRPRQSRPARPRASRSRPGYLAGRVYQRLRGVKIGTATACRADPSLDPVGIFQVWMPYPRRTLQDMPLQGAGQAKPLRLRPSSPKNSENYSLPATPRDANASGGHWYAGTRCFGACQKVTSPLRRVRRPPALAPRTRGGCGPRAPFFGESFGIRRAGPYGERQRLWVTPCLG